MNEFKGGTYYLYSYFRKTQMGVEKIYYLTLELIKGTSISNPTKIITAPMLEEVWKLIATVEIEAESEIQKLANSLGSNIKFNGKLYSYRDFQSKAGLVQSAHRIDINSCRTSSKRPKKLKEDLVDNFRLNLLSKVHKLSLDYFSQNSDLNQSKALNNAEKEEFEELKEALFNSYSNFYYFYSKAFKENKAYFNLYSTTLISKLQGLALFLRSLKPNEVPNYFYFKVTDLNGVERIKILVLPSTLTLKIFQKLYRSLP